MHRDARVVYGGTTGRGEVPDVGLGLEAASSEATVGITASVKAKVLTFAEVSVKTAPAAKKGGEDPEEPEMPRRPALENAVLRGELSTTREIADLRIRVERKRARSARVSKKAGVFSGR